MRKKRMTKKLYSASERLCKKLMGIYKAIKRKHESLKNQRYDSKVKMLGAIHEAEQMKWNYLQSLEAYWHSEDRLPPRVAAKIISMKEELYRLKDEVRIAELELSNFSAENESVEEHMRRKRFVALRRKYIAMEEDYWALSQEDMNLRQLRRASLDSDAALEEYCAQRAQYRMAIFNKRSRRKEYESLKAKEARLQLEASAAWEKYIAAEKGHYLEKVKNKEFGGKTASKNLSENLSSPRHRSQEKKKHEQNKRFDENIICAEHQSKG